MVFQNKRSNIFGLKKLFVESEARDKPLVQEIISRLNNVPVEFVDDYRRICVEGESVDTVYKESKKYLVLAQKKGDFVKEFRCMDGLVGRTEYFISHGNNCHMDCKYCFLQGYFDHAIPTIFINHDDILSGIESFITDSADEKLLFHAGELCDSFTFDFLTGFSRKLINLFARYPKARLELRTKTTFIDNLLDIPGKENTIISWTFSPDVVTQNYESKTPSFDERLEAARKVQNSGYRVGICLDPIINVNSWFKSYESMINRLFDNLDAELIDYVSLGGFRFLPSLTTTIRERGCDNNLFSGEFVPGIDGKYRYFRPVRTDIYRKIAKIIRTKNRKVKVFLCMETPDVWKDVADVLR